MTRDAVQLDRALARLEAVLAETGGAAVADNLAEAVGRHLAGLEPGHLPAAAGPTWHRLAHGLLKADPTRPLPERAAAAIRAWPAARAAELVALVGRLRDEVARAANDALADATNERVARSYL